MKKLILAAALTLITGVTFPQIVAAQAVGPQSPSRPGLTAAELARMGSGSEVCVNASLEATAKRLFPAATIHVIPDDSNPLRNGWRIVSGRDKLMTDAEEIYLRQRELNRDPGD